MFKNLLTACLTLLLNPQIFSQTSIPYNNDYRSVHNKNYWKNRPPHSSYWQQDVYYRIQAELNDSSETLSANEQLIYHNNSPHTLNQIFFHLYQNATLKGSLVQQRYQKNKIKTQLGPHESQGLGTQIHKISVNNTEIVPEIDRTIMKVQLPQALKPGDSITINIQFTTYFDRGSVRRRMKVYDHHGLKHFNGVHWYPRICVYDAKFSWETDQHLEREFYGNFGCFDLSLTLPEHYIVEATGVLQNPSEALPDSLREKIDLRHFKDKPYNSTPSTPIPASKKRKTWKFHANNVHDIAFTADPSYRLGEVVHNGVTCIAIAQENNAAYWQKTAEYTARVIAYYNQLLGPYEYPKIVVADAADGMEYPMLALCGGLYPSHRNLIAHEVGHNWFQGMIGSNETYRSSLDEGFTQYINALALRDLNIEPQAEIYRFLLPYVHDVMDNEDTRLNTHSNEFGNAVGQGGGYHHVYMKTASMLHALNYVLGDSLFLAAIKHYVKKWKFAHPYTEDFRQSIIEFAQTDLNKFFDQWLETTENIDYGIKKVKRLKSGDYQITIERKGNLIMPVNLKILLENSQGELAIEPVNIPNSHFQNPEISTHAPIWHSWGNLNTQYIYHYTCPKQNKIKQIYLPLLADIHQLDNTWKNRFTASFDWGNSYRSTYLNPYEIYYRPALRYNVNSGLQAGLFLKGNYAERRHVFELHLLHQVGPTPLRDLPVHWPSQNLNAWLHYYHNIIGGGTYHADIITTQQRLNAKVGWFMNLGSHRFGIYAKHLQGLYGSRAERIPTENPLSQHQFANTYPGYIPTPTLWNPQSNLSLNLFWNIHYNQWSYQGDLLLQSRLASPWSQTQFGYVNLTWNHNHPLGKSEIKSRFFIQYGGGETPSPESALYAAMANPETAFENPIMRDFGTANYGKTPITTTDPFAKNNPQFLHFGGGLNLRGYHGRTLGMQAANSDTLIAFFRGSSGFSGNLEWYWGKFFNGFAKNKYFRIEPYFFGDAGIMILNPSKQDQIAPPLLISKPLFDAGIGTLIHLNNLAKPFSSKVLQKTKPLVFRIDIPFFLSHTLVNEKNLSFRLLLGISRCF